MKLQGKHKEKSDMEQVGGHLISRLTKQINEARIAYEDHTFESLRSELVAVQRLTKELIEYCDREGRGDER